jgi:RNA polymerase sigma-70 factor (ECF subfamily)
VGSAREFRTNITLLERLARSGAGDHAAWERFVDQYGLQIFAWCRGLGLQPADAEDVTQTVLVKLAGAMKNFQYDPALSFRAWLKRVTVNAWKSFARREDRPDKGSGAQWVYSCLENARARDELVMRIEESYDRELMEIAMRMVRPRVAPHNWKAFVLTAIEGLDAADVAKRLEMRIARVYAARSTLQKKLREECEKLQLVETCR